MRERIGDRSGQLDAESERRRRHARAQRREALPEHVAVARVGGHHAHRGQEAGGAERDVDAEDCGPDVLADPKALWDRQRAEGAVARAQRDQGARGGRGCAARREADDADGEQRAPAVAGTGPDAADQQRREGKRVRGGESLLRCGADLEVLGVIEQHGPLTAGRLGRATGLSPAAVTGLIDRLERARVAARGPDRSYRRRVLVSVALGAARIAELRTHLERAALDAVARYVCVVLGRGSVGHGGGMMAADRGGRPRPTGD